MMIALDAHLVIEGKQRRLAAILMLDVVGYSRLMAEDETGTLSRFLDVRSTSLEPIISKHDGRIVKLMGDGALVEFLSVTEAMQCAIEIQEDMAKLNADSVDIEPLNLRIGINLGEVIVDDDDIYGNGVNVAARVETLARPGGIAITGTVREHLRANLKVGFEDAGDVEVKNIPQPIRVFHVRSSDAELPEISATVRAGSNHRRYRPWIGVAIALVAAALSAVWWTTYSSSLGPASDSEVQISDKPSVAVMPFDNLSGDVEQKYFSDGMTDNLITDLSQIGGLLVIARNTSFSFRDRGEATDAQSVGETLGVRYVVQGSVQRAGSHLRINTNLIDARTGLQVWASRFDREFKELFALQDEVATRIIDALQVELTEEERRQLSRRYTTSLPAYDLYLRAWGEIWRFNAEGRAKSQELLRTALELDPDFAIAKALLATSYTNRTGAAFADNDAMLEVAFDLATDAVELAPDIPAVQSTIGLVHMFRREFEEADEAFDRAIELAPSNADAIAMQAWSRHFSGQSELALEGLSHAMILNPRAPFPYLNAIAEVHLSLGNYEESIRYSLDAVSRNPEALRLRILLAAAYSELGQIDDAQWEIEEALLLQPELSLASMYYISPYRDPETMERLIQALRTAGLPE